MKCILCMYLTELEIGNTSIVSSNVMKQISCSAFTLFSFFSHFFPMLQRLKLFRTSCMARCGHPSGTFCRKGNGGISLLTGCIYFRRNRFEIIHNSIFCSPNARQQCCIARLAATTWLDSFAVWPKNAKHSHESCSRFYFAWTPNKLKGKKMRGEWEE